MKHIGVLVKQLKVVKNMVKSENDGLGKAVIDRAIAELMRYSVSAGVADQYKGEAKACRVALGFPAESEEVSPNELTESIQRLNCRVEFFQERLKDPKWRTSKTLQQQCKMLDQWMKDSESI